MSLHTRVFQVARIENDLVRMALLLPLVPANLIGLLLDAAWHDPRLLLNERFHEFNRLVHKAMWMGEFTRKRNK